MRASFWRGVACWRTAVMMAVLGNSTSNDHGGAIARLDKTAPDVGINNVGRQYLEVA